MRGVQPGRPFTTALEANQGAFADWGVEVGDRMTLDDAVKLVGAGGEPVDLWRTIQSHGARGSAADADRRRGARTRGDAAASAASRERCGSRQGDAARPPSRSPAAQPSAAEEKRILAAVRHVLRLDEDLSPFYALAAEDPDLAWVDGGRRSARPQPDRLRGGREDDLHDELRVVGDGAHGRPRSSSTSASRRWARRTGRTAARSPRRARWPRRASASTRTPCAPATEAPYLRSLAESVASGELDLEVLASEELSDEETEARLLALPGVGPYAAAHVMMLLGRYHRLVLDSWTRPTYARLAGGRPKKDATIERRFRRYGPYAGLAFWCFVTRDWVE